MDGQDAARLDPVHEDEDWESHATVRYFTYELHVSKQFLIATTLTSALYLCVIRFLSRSYEECFMLADAIATDHAFNADEQQIFNLLTLHETSGMKNNANAAACLCKIALAFLKASKISQNSN